MSIAQFKENTVKEVQVLNTKYLYIRKQLSLTEDYLSIYEFRRNNNKSEIQNIRLVESFRVNKYLHISLNKIPQKNISQHDLLAMKTGDKNDSQSMKSQYENEFIIVAYK